MPVTTAKLDVEMLRLLAFDTATERLSVAVSARGRVWAHDAAGGALASATLIPAILDLLGEAGITIGELDAIVFGRGPGAFTGLRCACSVAQGLAFGANKPVLPIDTLLAVAEEARGERDALRVWTAIDARMDEIYAAQYAYADGAWTVLDAPMLTTPDALNARWRDSPPEALAGSAIVAFGARLTTGDATLVPEAIPHARAMLPLAEALWANGGAVDALHAAPLYLRDKVAHTTREREAIRAAKEATT